MNDIDIILDQDKLLVKAIETNCIGEAKTLIQNNLKRPHPYKGNIYSVIAFSELINKGYKYGINASSIGGNDSIGVLHLLAFYGRVDLLQYALKLGADIHFGCSIEPADWGRLNWLTNYWDWDAGETPLYFACGAGQDKIIKILLEKGAKSDLNRCARYSALNPIANAILYGHSKTVRLLINEGAELNTPIFITNENTGKDSHYWDGFSYEGSYTTLLGYTILLKKWEIAKILIEKGASPCGQKVFEGRDVIPPIIILSKMNCKNANKLLELICYVKYANEQLSALFSKVFSNMLRYEPELEKDRVIKREMVSIFLKNLKNPNMEWEYHSPKCWSDWDDFNANAVIEFCLNKHQDFQLLQILLWKFRRFRTVIPEKFRTPFR